MAIIAIIALVTVDYLVNASRVYTLLLAQRQADSELMDAVDRMRRAFRTATHLDATNDNQWSFENINIQGLTNTMTNMFLLTGQQTVTLNGNILARGVNRFQFTYYDKTNARATNLAAIDHVELAFKVTNSQAASEMVVNFFLREGFLK